ncbi:hypothetical protein, partial [Staphylococcus epidermidis]|uniref:hypothetical protein n=1 Tax=Staphylococcus epidermidis TaxID=1282 RepID=UPI0037DA7317
MNIPQLLQLHLPIPPKNLPIHVPSPLFHPPNHHHLSSTIQQPPIPPHPKTLLYHPRTPQPFHNPISLPVIYILKLPHIVHHKLHPPSTRPYSLVTQQPLRA